MQARAGAVWWEWPRFSQFVLCYFVFIWGINAEDVCIVIWCYSWFYNSLYKLFLLKYSWFAIIYIFMLLLLSHFSCVQLCGPIDGSPPGSPVPGILQARTLEWVAISFSNVWKWKVKVKLLSSVQLLATPWTTAYQAPPSMGFSRQEYWSGVPLLSLLFIAVAPYSQ